MTFVKLQDTEMGIVSDQDGPTCGWLCVLGYSWKTRRGSREKWHKLASKEQSQRSSHTHAQRSQIFKPSFISANNKATREKGQQKWTNHNIFEWMTRAFMESTSRFLRNSLLSTKTPCTTQPLTSVYLWQLTLSKKALYHALCCSL